VFQPRLKQHDPERGKLFAAVQAVSHGVQTFEQAASVLSTANVNTAALTLFLALNLVDESVHKVLVLDDPVQNMDDMRIVNLAGLLRSLVREANRQLIVATHERALFDYLALELGPTTQKGSLIMLELQRSTDGNDSTISHKREEWKPDAVTFGPRTSRAG
jgi:DNA repair protein SbcC/Rad50